MDRRGFLRAGAAATGGALAGASIAACGSAKTAPSGRPRPSRFSHLAGLGDGLSVPGPADFLERRERAREVMREMHLWGLAIEPGPTMRYFAGVEWGRSERPFFLLILVKEEPACWICPAFEERTARERIPADHELRIWQEDESAARIAARFLREWGNPYGPVGVDPTMRTFLAESLREQLPFRAGVRLAEEAIRRCRMVKSAKELALLRRASEITKRCVAEVAPLVVEGVTEAEISAAMGDAHRAAGMTSPWALVLFGPNASFPHGTNKARRLEEGDTVLIDTGASLHGYQSDVTRTWVLGRPSDRVARAYDAVFRAQKAAREAVRPGRTCGEIDGVARAVIDEAGFGTGYAAFTHRLGHGIGMEGHEEPYLVRGNETALVPGMTFSDEPGIYVPGEFGIRIEDILAVTEGNAELFGSDPPSEPRAPR